VTVTVGAPTWVTLTVSTTSPKINEQVTFTATLTHGDTGVPITNKPVTIYHYFNGVRYDDAVNKLTDGAGKATFSVSFGSTGFRNYYATFAGDGQNAVSTSYPVTVTVGPQSTTMGLSVMPPHPALNDQVTITANLRVFYSEAALANKPVTIYHYFNGVRYDDAVNKLTDSNGNVAATASFSSPGDRYYYATFGGDSQMAAVTGGPLDINPYVY
jgi:hypothetical protein